MRTVRVDIAGTTDINGNATIPVPLDNTGEFQNLKFALGLPSPAEWAITASGTQLTYGRGRRVTLGPELIKPQDVSAVKIIVLGGPPNAPVLGSATGTAGTEFDMVLVHQPTPNTIALDAALNFTTLKVNPGDTGIYTVNDTALHTFLFPLPAGTQVVRVITVFAVGGTVTTYRLTGNVTPLNMGTYVDNGGVVPNGQKLDQSVRLLSPDTAVQLQVQLAGGAGLFFLVMANAGLSDIVVEPGAASIFSVLEVPGSGEWKADGGTPAQGVGAVAAQAGTAGKSLVCRWLHAELVAGGAANAVTRWSLTDGTFTLNGTLGVQAAGSSHQLVMNGMQIKAAAGATLTLTISGLANAFATCSMGGDTE